MKKQNLQLSFRFLLDHSGPVAVAFRGFFGVRLCPVPKVSHLQWVQTVFWISLVNISLKGKVGQRPKKNTCLLYTSPSPRDRQKSRMPSSA